MRIIITLINLHENLPVVVVVLHLDEPHAPDTFWPLPEAVACSAAQ